MYQEGEILEVVEAFGKKDKRVEVGTKVEFVKTADTADLGQSLIAVKLGDRIIVTKETNVRIRSWWRRRQAFRAFNKQMMINNPRLRRYSPNPFVKYWFRAYYWFVDLRSKNGEV